MLMENEKNADKMEKMMPVPVEEVLEMGIGIEQSEEVMGVSVSKDEVEKNEKTKKEVIKISSRKSEVAIVDTKVEESVEGENEYLIKFANKYEFEGEIYTEVDLSGVREFRGKDLWKINRAYNAKGNISITPKMDDEYTAMVASRVSGLPIEFFEGLSLRDGEKVRVAVTGFFYGEE